MAAWGASARTEWRTRLGSMRLVAERCRLVRPRLVHVQRSPSKKDLLFRPFGSRQGSCLAAIRVVGRRNPSTFPYCTSPSPAPVATPPAPQIRLAQLLLVPLRPPPRPSAHCPRAQKGEAQRPLLALRQRLLHPVVRGHKGRIGPGAELPLLPRPQARRTPLIAHLVQRLVRGAVLGAAAERPSATEGALSSRVAPQCPRPGPSRRAA